jgi:hypothetical protein
MYIHICRHGRGKTQHWAGNGKVPASGDQSQDILFLKRALIICSLLTRVILTSVLFAQCLQQACKTSLLREFRPYLEGQSFGSNEA